MVFKKTNSIKSLKVKNLLETVNRDAEIEQKLAEKENSIEKAQDKGKGKQIDKL